MAINDLNYDSKLSVDDLKFKSQSDEREMLNRTRLVLGDFSGIRPRFGIVDFMDPHDLVETDTNRPLLVKSETDLRVSVSAGVVVCPNGAMVHLDEKVFNFELARTLVNDVVVVFLENEIVSSGVSRVTRYLVPSPTRRTQSPEKLRSALLSDYNNQSLFPASRKQNIVVIAVVKVVDSVEGVSLLLDYTDNDYPFNRPWYSPVDAEHRSSKGSGAVTPRNPHGMTFNDLSSGEIPFYSQLSSVGCILAKDRDIKGRPGYACVETIDPARLLVDSMGSVTAESRFGAAGAKYLMLTNYPTSVNSLVLSSHKSRDIAFDWIPGTRILVIPDSEVFTEQATVYYNRVSALELPSSILGNKITFGAPDVTNEQMVSGGISYDTVVNPVLEFEGTGPVARRFQVYLNDNGDLVRFPQVLQNTLLLDQIGGDYTPVEVNQFGPAQIGMALVDATPNASLKVVVRIYGRNSQGVTITEDLTFDDTWVSPILPAAENLGNLAKTVQVFSTITGFQVTERVSDGSSSKIIIYAEVESGVAPRLNSLTKVATVNWDGISVSDARDARKIVPYFPGYESPYRAPAEISASLLGSSYLATEDVRYPSFNQVISGNQAATNASAYLNFTSNVSIGDTVTLKTGVTLVAVSSNPDRMIGEFLKGTDATETRDDFVTTLNSNAGLGFTATADGATRARVVCSTPGTRGNSQIVVNTAIFPSITKESDFEDGYDSFGESVISHHQDVIDTVTPLFTTYDVSNYRDRYLSRAFPIQYQTTVKLLLHGTGFNPGNVQVRFRVALDTLDWGQWEVAASTSSLFTITKSASITKIQFQIFGKFGGFSLYSGDSGGGGGTGGGGGGGTTGGGGGGGSPEVWHVNIFAGITTPGWPVYTISTDDGSSLILSTSFTDPADIVTDFQSQVAASAFMTSAGIVMQAGITSFDLVRTTGSFNLGGFPSDSFYQSSTYAAP